MIRRWWARFAVRHLRMNPERYLAWREFAGPATRRRKPLRHATSPPAALIGDWSRMNHGICPKCGEDKFIGHGPLCIDCFTA